MAIRRGRQPQAGLALPGLHRRHHRPVRCHRGPRDPTQHHCPVRAARPAQPRYRVIASDVTEGDPGNGERLAFLYDSKRVQPSGLVVVGEVVLPTAATSTVQQFARTPYAAGFVRHDTDFILTTVHVLWGKSPSDRIAELTAIATWMRTWADRPQDWNRNLLVLGDFNLDRIDDPLFDAFVSTGLWPPTELNHVPRTIFDNDKQHHFYDQIAWFSDPLNRTCPPCSTACATPSAAAASTSSPTPYGTSPNPGLLAHQRPLPTLGRDRRDTTPATPTPARMTGGTADCLAPGLMEAVNRRRARAARCWLTG